MKELEQITKEFFDKESKRRNITIEDLLEKYKIDAELFHKQLYYYTNHINFQVLAKIKEENKRRKENKESLEVYRSLKGKDKTFGDVAREKNCTVDRITELLNADYLTKGIANYSFEKLRKYNENMLRTRSQMEMYFYFWDNDVTFEELAQHYNIEEVDVIYYFDTLMVEELTIVEINNSFNINKSRKQEKIYMQQYRSLGRLFALTDEEKEQIDSMIEFREKNHLYKNSEILRCVKERLSDDSPLGTEICQDKTISYDNLRKQFQSDWLKILLGPKIVSKFKIRGLISNKFIYKQSAEKVAKMSYYLSFYALYLNTPSITCSEFKKKYGIDLSDGKHIDEMFGIHVFQKIASIVNHAKKIEQFTNKGTDLSSYYQENFIFLKDLAALIGVEEWEIVNYFNSNLKNGEWKQIYELEKQRKALLEKNIQVLSKFQELVKLWRHYMVSDNYEKIKIGDDLTQLIQMRFSFHELETSDSQIDMLLCSVQTIIFYLKQMNYDIQNLEKSFNVNADTIHRYLYHPLVTRLLDFEVVAYINNKRQIQKSLICMNQERNTNGQFVKKIGNSEV